MKPRSFVLRSVILLFIGLALTLGYTSGGLASTPTPDHTAHHAASPTPDNAGAGSATPTPGGTGMGGQMPMNGTPAAGMMTTMEFDLAFIDMMIAHHDGAIAMAKVALERGEHAEIRALAEEIVASQGKEIDQLRAWRAEWYPDAPVMSPSDMMRMPGMSEMMGGMDMMPMMSTGPAPEANALRSATEPFDLAFLDAMIPHHESAIMMAEAALQHAVRTEVKELARGIVDAQRSGIEDMQRWHAAWYGDDPDATPNASSDPTTVDVTLSEFAIDLSTSSVFRVGQSYQFVVTNRGALPHEFMILPEMPDVGAKDMEDLDNVAVGMISEDELGSGSTESIEVTFNQAGTFELACALPGHYDAGMKLEIEVAP